jgi:anti-sigma B factor antagonist/stage II sporulation protein AA (anti-sigma F factor antagonist)
MEDFTKEHISEAIVINVNLTRATLKEAIELRKIVDEELVYNHKNLILDLSQCEFIDSTFLGAILVEHKKVIKKGGKLSIVEPENLWGNLIAISRTLEKLNIYKTREEVRENIDRKNLPPVREVFKPSLNI